MAGEDPKYTSWVRTLKCCACGAHPPTHAHHMTGAGMGKRAHDDTCIPLCVRCHSDLHGFRGRFANMSREERRLWQEKHVADTRRAR